MSKQFWLAKWGARVFCYLLDYVSYSFYSFFVIELFFVCTIIVLGSGIEKLFVKVFVALPLGLWLGSGDFSIGNRQILTVMAFWVFVVMMLSKAMKKVVKFKINGLWYFVVFTLLHLVSMIRLGEVSGSWSMIVSSYIGSLFCLLIYRGMRKVVDAIQEFTDKFFV